MILEILNNGLIIVPDDVVIVNVEDAKVSDEAYLFSVIEIDASFEGADKQLVFASSLEEAKKVLKAKHRMLSQMVKDGHIDFGNDKVPAMRISNPDTRLIGKKQWMPIIIKS